ncbi:PIG-L family deacetylase [Paenibacillus sp. GD4]|uniref:PIG-L deacetylase family protein n=1 Tax=Paenibacillus sp. GD4 TaxID=3068890 RepID=UPI00279683ED|nr:PIG-L family deacetylase [Paenibacillus sp. GD4]MDQ1914639.1 PIG-L family deacetylase [Paenibacillus sp. GD4]
MNAHVVFCYAHPDDETFLSGCLIRMLADRGHPPALLLATRGDAGNKNGAYTHLSRAELGELREKEMELAARVLHLGKVEYLGLPDGKLSEADETLFLNHVVNFINRLQPAAVFTFPPNGGNFHPDHMAISRVTTKAVVGGSCPSVAQLYYMSSDTLAKEGHRPTFTIDTKPLWNVKADALRAHDSQILAIERYFGKLHEFPEERRYEAFVLAWERGRHWPVISEEKALKDLKLK